MAADDPDLPVSVEPAAEAEIRHGEVLPPGGTALVAASPAGKIAPGRSGVAGRRSRRTVVGLLILLVVGAGGAGAYWWRTRPGGLLAGIASGNGRIEADEIDIDSKFAGRIAEMLADEGDMVKAGQVVARMDTRDLEASLRKSEAQVQVSQKSRDEARANVEQQKTQVTFANQEFERTNSLVTRGFATNELLDQRRQALNGATAALTAANDRVGAAERAIEAAAHDAELYRVNIADNTLVAPRDGRIQYRIANIGEVLPAGGRVFTMLDIAYVYMDIYLPTAEAGRVRIGADARITLDAVPDVAIPAKVSFVAAQAQFTPKMVETKDERDKLMFRIRVKIDPDRLRARADRVRSGLPGVGYVREDPAAAWPPRLQGTATQ